MSSGRRLGRAARTALAALVSLAPVAALANETVVITLAVPNKIEEPTIQHVGYVDRIANPILRVRPFDPSSECVVFLEDGPAASDASVAPPTTSSLEIGAASFRTAMLPLIGGSSVDIRNVGKNTHPISSPGLPELEGPPIGPGGVRSILIPPTDSTKVYHLMSKDAPHVQARIMAMPSKYFARAGIDGRFKILDVPPGKWTVRVWYRDWLLPVVQTIDVGPRLKPVTVTLPERLTPVAASPAAGSAGAPASPPAGTAPTK